MRTPLLFAFAATFVLLLCTCKKDQAQLGTLKVSPPLSDRIKTQDAKILSFRDGDARVEIRLINAQKLAAEFNLIKLNIRSLYDQNVAPYAGFISNTVMCDPKYKPTEVKFAHGNLAFEGYRFFANNRYSIGACRDSQVAFQVFHGTMNCSKGDAFELQVFVPTVSSDAQLQQYLKTFSCRSENEK